MNPQYQPHVSEYKKNEVKHLVTLFNEYPIVGIINLENLPAVQLQKMNKKLRDSMKLIITKKSFMQIAIEQLKEKKNLDKVASYLQGVPALLFSKENPFRLYKILEKAQTPAAARPGQKAPYDIILPAGPTPFTPGPMIGELGQMGIKTEVKEGKINIREDKVIIRAGEEIKPKVADLLVKFGIQPMKIGLNMVAAYEDGEILTKEVLHVDEEAYKHNFQTAYLNALKLAMSISYISKETIELMIKKAYYGAKSVMEAGKLTEEMVTGEKVEVKAEPKQETKQEVKPVVQPVMKQEEKHTPQEQKSVDKIESKETFDQASMDAAQKLVRELQERTVTINKPIEKKKVPQEKDITKLINELKDKKSRGEI